MPDTDRDRLLEIADRLDILSGFVVARKAAADLRAVVARLAPLVWSKDAPTQAVSLLRESLELFALGVLAESECVSVQTSDDASRKGHDLTARIREYLDGAGPNPPPGDG